MSNPNKAKGTRWESQLRDYMNASGFDTYRPAQAGFADTGDIHGLPFFTVQAKDWKDTTSALRVGTDGARKQALNAGMPYGVNVVKRARKPIGDAYAVMAFDDFLRLVRQLVDA